MGSALGCVRAQGQEKSASPEPSVSREPFQKNEGPEAVGDAVKSKRAALHGAEAHKGAEIEQQHLPFSAVAQAELSSAHSSRSSASQASSRRVGGMLRSTSNRDLDNTVREWQQPHVWLEKGPPASPCEQERLSTLYSIAPGGQLENLQHPKFGPLLDLACKIFCTNNAAVSLMDATAMYVLEGRGMVAGGARLEDAWAAGSFCCWSTVSSMPSVLAVEDALLDVRFQGSSFVTGEAGIRFYIGAPLIASNGHRLGMICVYDTKPRKVYANTAQIVCNLAELAVRELESNWAIQVRQQWVKSAVRCLDCYQQGFLFLDLAHPDSWLILYASPEAVKQTGLPAGVLDCFAFWVIFKCESGDQDALQAWLKAVEQDEGFVISGLRRRRSAERDVPDTVWDVEFRPAAKETLSGTDCAMVGIPADLPALVSQKRLYVAQLKQKPEGLAEGATTAVTTAASARNRKEDTAVEKRDCGRPTNIPFAGCEVGQLISEDGPRRFYRGLYHGQPVVLKVIDTSQLDIKGGDDLALTSRVTTRLKHPCIVRTLAHCVTAAPSSRPWDSAGSAPSKSSNRDACWMLLEFCDKGTLQDAILRGSFLEGKMLGAPVDVKAVLSAALEVAMGMAYLHGRDLIHGNLNGDSVWLQSGCTPQGFHCKVGCFALSRSAILARLAAPSYTPISHFPPELLKDQIITKAADAYAFGILMWELYTCSRAWANLTHVQVAQAVFMNSKLQWPAATPPKLRRLASACMAYDPEDRPLFSECVEQLHDMWAMYDRCGD